MELLEGILQDAFTGALAAFLFGGYNQRRKSMADNGSKKAILVVSFGTSYEKTRKITIEAIEEEIAGFFAEYGVRRAFTSPAIIRKLQERDGLSIDNVEQALGRLEEGGYKTVVVQPTYVMNGFEYDDMREAVTAWEDRFEKIVCGAPLLSSDEDYSEMVRIIAEETKEYRQNGADIVFMGHGSKHSANKAYDRLNQALALAGCDRCMVGTIESYPALKDIMGWLEKKRAKKVILLPLMIVAGDHVVKDMAGKKGGSWKQECLARGFEVECLVRGLGEYRGIRRMFVRHVREAIAGLNEGT